MSFEAYALDEGFGTSDNDVASTRPWAPGVSRSGWRSAVSRELASGNAPVWFAFSMALGAAHYASAAREIAWLPIVLALVCAGASRIVARQNPVISAGVMLLLALMLGMALAKWESYVAATPMMVGEATTRVTGVVEERSTDGRGRHRYVVAIRSTADPKLQFEPARAKMFAAAKHDPLPIGSGFEALVRLRQPGGPLLPGAYDFAFADYHNGIGAQGFVLGKPRMTTSEVVYARLASLRAQIADTVRSTLAGREGAVAAALMMGDKRGIPEDVTEALRVSGMAHILAISGLHMVLVSGIVIAALRFGLALPGGGAASYPTRKIAAAAALVAAGCYLSLSGLGISAQRAFIMLCVLLIAVLADRPALTMRNVGIAAILVIALNPSAVVGPGFQMSFGATAALIATYSAWKRVRGRWLARTPKLPAFVRSVSGFVIGLAVTSVVAGAATGLFAAYHFYRIAPLGLLANLLAMPIVTMVVMPFGVLSALAMPFGMEEPFLRVMGFGIDLVLRISTWVASLRPPVVTGQLSTDAFVLAVIGLFVLLACRTRLALLAIVPLAAGALLSQPDRASLIVAEGGKLAGILADGSIHLDRPRGSSFVTRNWENAFRASVNTADGPAARFSCDGSKACAATYRGLRVTSIRDFEQLGEACDTADIVLIAKRAREARCRSGAWVIGTRHTGERGAVAIDLDRLAANPDLQPRRRGQSRLIGLSATVLDDMATWALPKGARPWTEHRYYRIKRSKPVDNPG